MSDNQDTSKKAEKLKMLGPSNMEEYKKISFPFVELKHPTIINSLSSSYIHPHLHPGHTVLHRGKVLGAHVQRLAEIGLSGAPSGHIVDVGSNSGYVAIMLSTLLKTRRARENKDFKLHCIEANPQLIYILNKNLSAHLDHTTEYEIYNAGAHIIDEEFEYRFLDITKVPDCGSADLSSGPRLTRSKKINLLKIDTMLENIKGPVVLIKIDIEGAELKALQGTKEILEQDSPALIIEILDQHWSESKSDLLRFLKSMNYKLESRIKNDYLFMKESKEEDLKK